MVNNKQMLEPLRCDHAACPIVPMQKIADKGVASRAQSRDKLGRANRDRKNTPQLGHFSQPLGRMTDLIATTRWGRLHKCLLGGSYFERGRDDKRIPLGHRLV
jgi:hypothetical protein